MPAPHIRVEYDNLGHIKTVFNAQSQTVRQMAQSLKARYDPLRGGGWVGRGAQAYFQEMEGMVFPEFQRLQSALAEAARATERISQIFQDAQQEAARLMLPFGEPGASGQPGAQAPGGAGPNGGGGAGPGAGPGAQPGSRGGGGGSGGRSMGPLDFLKMLNDASKYPKGARNLLRLIREGMNVKGVPVPKWIEFVTRNPAIRAVSRGFSLFDVGFKAGQFARDPNLQTGADLTVGGIGLYGTLASGPGAAVATAFSFGYWVGGTFIAPHTTEPLSNLLMKWDPLDLNNSARNYPRTTIKDYERSGQPMPRGVANDVYVGLMKASGAKAAGQFARQYAQQNNMSVTSFQRGLSFPHNVLPIR